MEGRRQPHAPRQGGNLNIYKDQILNVKSSSGKFSKVPRDWELGQSK